MWEDGKTDSVWDAGAVVRCVRVVLAGTSALAAAFCLLPAVDRGFFAFFFGGLIGLELLAYGYAAARLRRAFRAARAEAARHPEPPPPPEDETEAERLRRAKELWRREEEQMRAEERQAAREAGARRRQTPPRQTNPRRRRAWEDGQRAAQQASRREDLVDDLERQVVHPWPHEDDPA